MIRRIEFKNRKRDLRFDPVRKVWIGWQIDIRCQGRRIRPTFRTKQEAENFVESLRLTRAYRRNGLPAPNTLAPRVSNLFEERLREVKEHKANVRARRIFGSFQDALEFDIPVPAIRKSHFRQFIRRRELDGVTPETINREINELSAAFRRAAEIFPEALEDYEPKIVRPRVKKRKPQRRIISEAEKDAIVWSILADRSPRENRVRTRNRPVVAGVFELGWLLGLRLSEILRLQPGDYNRERKELRVVRWKTETVTHFDYLPECVIEVLEKAWSNRGNCLFNLTCSVHTFTDIFRQACRTNGLPYGRSQVGALTFHSTRHSFTTRLVQVTDIATAGEFTGHSSKEMVDWYSQPTEESKRLAMEKMYRKG